jgi:hypothetical protein
MRICEIQALNWGHALEADHVRKLDLQMGDQLLLGWGGILARLSVRLRRRLGFVVPRMGRLWPVFRRRGRVKAHRERTATGA